MDQLNGLDVPKSLADVCRPERLALLVYDMQVGILEQIADRQTVIENVREVLEAARVARVRTYFTRHVTLPVALMGVATEIGIEPTVRHAGDLGFIPVVVTDACASGNAEAGARTMETLRFLGDAMLTDVAGFRDALRGRN